MKKTIVILVAGFLLCTVYSLYSCGGGVVPYVPTSSGAGGSTSSGSFFLLEKGVAVEMFDVKKLQPLFRNIVLSGNERKVHRNMGKVLAKYQTTSKQDSTAMKNSVHGAEISDSTLPVLNLHRLH